MFYRLRIRPPERLLHRNTGGGKYDRHNQGKRRPYATTHISHQVDARLGCSLLVAAVFAASPALAASSVVIATNDPHKTLIAGDIDGTNPLAVAYQKNS